MLREYQDEIKRLKDQLDATQRGVIIGEDGKVIKDKWIYHVLLTSFVIS